MLLLGIACTAPTIFVAAGAAYEDFLLRKERVYEAALASARSLAGELEQELRGVETGLRILATEDELNAARCRPSIGGWATRCACRTWTTCCWTRRACR